MWSFASCGLSWNTLHFPKMVWAGRVTHDKRNQESYIADLRLAFPDLALPEMTLQSTASPVRSASSRTIAL